MTEKQWCCNAPIGEHEPTCKNASLPPVRTEPLLAVYSKFKHLDNVFEMVTDAKDTDPFHTAARDMWRAIKASLGPVVNHHGELREGWKDA